MSKNGMRRIHFPHQYFFQTSPSFNIKNKIIKYAIALLLLFTLKVFIASAEAPLEIKKPHEQTYQELIQELWGNKSNIAFAVLQAENKSLDKNVIGYNCRYGDKITSCKTIADRTKAISIDCGLWQINEKTAPCDTKAFDPVESTLRAKKIYDERQKQTGDGFEAWYTYKNKLHLKYL